MKTLERSEAWNHLVLSESRTLTLSSLHRLLYGTGGDLHTPFAVAPLDHQPVTPEQLRGLEDDLKATFDGERLGHDLVHEVYSGKEDGKWLWLPCVIAYGRFRDDLLLIMNKHGISYTLIAEDSGFLLLGKDGQTELLTECLDPSSAWEAWRTWSRRRHPEGTEPHALYLPPGTLAEHRALMMDTRKRLDERYAHMKVESAIRRVMDGEAPVITG